MKINEFVLFIKSFKNDIKLIRFSCSVSKVVIGGVNNKNSVLMFAQTLPMKFESTSNTKFEVAIQTNSFTNVFNVNRLQSKESKESKESNGMVQITLTSEDNYIYTISFLEEIFNKETKYNVDYQMTGLNNENYEYLDLQSQKLPDYLRKMKCPTKILTNILNNMSDKHVNVTLICTKSSLIVQNDFYNVEIQDETIQTLCDEDSYIVLNISNLIDILDTSLDKFIDIYFTGKNVIAFSNHCDSCLFTFYMKSE